MIYILESLKNVALSRVSLFILDPKKKKNFSSPHQRLTFFKIATDVIFRFSIHSIDELANEW